MIGTRAVLPLNTASEVTGDKGAQLLRYVDGKMLPLINDGVVKPNINHNTGYSWTNNNSESANHVLKAAVQWKPRSLPDLVYILRKLIKKQEKDMAWAILGNGNFRLAPSMAHHQVSVGQWSAMTKEQKKRRIAAFMSCRRRQSNQISVSRDGQLKVFSTPSGGKKPCQQKRKRAERSNSKKKCRQDFEL